MAFLATQLSAVCVARQSQLVRKPRPAHICGTMETDLGALLAPKLSILWRYLMATTTRQIWWIYRNVGQNYWIWRPQIPEQIQRIQGTPELLAVNNRFGCLVSLNKQCVCLCQIDSWYMGVCVSAGVGGGLYTLLCVHAFENCCYLLGDTKWLLWPMWLYSPNSCACQLHEWEVTAVA